MTEETLCINIDKEFNRSIKVSEKLFLEDKIFIYPTDTLYGIGGNAFKSNVITKIHNLKQRNDFKQFIFLINNINNLANYAKLNSAKHQEFLAAIWPGPATVILNSTEKMKEQLGIKTIAFRIPDNRFCLELLNRIDLPLISTSVNITGKTPIFDYPDIINEFKTKVNAIFYTIKNPGNIPSTIIDLTEKEPKLIREGKIKFVELLEKFN
jgi:L-threonylcarbamoyladenylate synthase